MLIGSLRLAREGWKEGWREGDREGGTEGACLLEV